jgi:hypothetical protein
MYFPVLQHLKKNEAKIVNSYEVEMYIYVNGKYDLH